MSTCATMRGSWASEGAALRATARADAARRGAARQPGVTDQPAAPLPRLDYPALRLRWCRLALYAFVRRWGVYGLVAMAVIGAGGNSPLDAAGALGGGGAGTAHPARAAAAI